MQDLKGKTIRAGAARLVAQVASVGLRAAALVVLARLLDPKDFGLVGMVTAFTGVLTWFRDFGLSAAAVQRSDITRDQRGVADGRDRDRHRRSRNRLRILGARRKHGDNPACREHGLLAGDGLG